jgi:hypothetical protein
MHLIVHILLLVDYRLRVLMSPREGFFSAYFESGVKDPLKEPHAPSLLES